MRRWRQSAHTVTDSSQTVERSKRVQQGKGRREGERVKETEGERRRRGKRNRRYVRFRSSVIEVTAASVRLELTASHERTDIRSLLLSRVITSSFLETPCGVSVHDSSIVTPSFSQRSRGAGMPAKHYSSLQQQQTRKHARTQAHVRTHSYSRPLPLTPFAWPCAANLPPWSGEPCAHQLHTVTGHRTRFFSHAF